MNGLKGCITATVSGLRIFFFAAVVAFTPPVEIPAFNNYFRD
jgi:hypothetical protein